MKYTKHGHKRANERGIKEELILDAISSPNLSFFDIGSATQIVFKKLNGKHILVAYISEENEFKVVTTFITGKLRSNSWVQIK